MSPEPRKVLPLPLFLALLDDDDARVRALVNAMLPAERRLLANAARKLHDLCTLAAQDRAAAAVAVVPVPVQPPFGGGLHRSSPPFTAQYNGRCPSCGESIFASVDMIVMTDHGAVHVDCEDEG